MEILMFSFNATMPIVLFMALGLFSRHLKIIELETAKKLNNFCFQILLPALVFYNIYRIDFQTEFSADLIIFACIAHVGVILALCFIFFPAMKDKAKAATFVHICYRSNHSMFGIAVVQNMFGEAGSRAAMMLLLPTVILFNFAAVVLLSYAQVKENTSTAAMLKEVGVNVLKNPLIVTCVFTILLALSPLSLPFFLYSTVRSVASVTIPFCLIVFGVQIDFKSLRSNMRTVLALSFARLVIVPFVMTCVAILAGFRGIELAALFSFYAAPVATAVSIMAYKYDVYPDLSTQALTITSAFCGFTIFAGISILRYLQFF